MGQLLVGAHARQRVAIRRASYRECRLRCLRSRPVGRLGVSDTIVVVVVVVDDAGNGARGGHDVRNRGHRPCIDAMRARSAMRGEKAANH